MPPARRTAALLRLALCPALAVAACTGGEETAPTPAPAPRPPFTELLASIDLDAAVGADLRPYDLAPLPGGGAVVLLGAEGTTALVEVTTEAGPVRPLPALRPGADAVPTQDGDVLVVGATEATGALVIVGPDGSAIPLAPGPDDVATARPDDPAPGPDDVATARPDDPAPGPVDVATALSSDGRTLHLATGTELRNLDPASGAQTASVGQPARATHLAAGPDATVTALLAVDRGERGTGVLLATYGPGLQPAGEPLDLLPDGSAARPAGLHVTDDGTAVVALGADPVAPSRPQLLTVAGGAVVSSIELRGTEDSALDLAVDPAGRYALVPLAAYQVEPGIVSFDLATGERVGEVVLCPTGAGSLGAVALSGDVLTATGVCLGSGLTTTAFVVG